MPSVVVPANWTNSSKPMVLPGLISSHIIIWSSFLSLGQALVSSLCLLNPQQLCRGALGDSFAGGTTDGPGAFDFTQGTNTTNKNPYWNFIADFIFDATEEDKACQVGTMSPSF
jgi:hypothetical protein